MASPRPTQIHITIAEIPRRARTSVIPRPLAEHGLEHIQMSTDWAAPLVDAFGSLDLQRAEAVKSCCVLSGFDDEGEFAVSVELTRTYAGREILFTFAEVQRARLPEATPGGLQLGDPHIEKVGGGLERIRYRMTDEVEAWLIECNRLTVRLL